MRFGLENELEDDDSDDGRYQLGSSRKDNRNARPEDMVVISDCVCEWGFSFRTGGEN